MNINQCYHLLGLQPTATVEEIKSAFRHLSLKVHPDKNPNNPEANNKFQKLTEARDNLVKHKENEQLKMKKQQKNEKWKEEVKNIWKETTKTTKDNITRTAGTIGGVIGTAAADKFGGTKNPLATDTANALGTALGASLAQYVINKNKKMLFHKIIDEINTIDSKNEQPSTRKYKTSTSKI